MDEYGQFAGQIGPKGMQEFPRRFRKTPELSRPLDFMKRGDLADTIKRSEDADESFAELLRLREAGRR